MTQIVMNWVIGRLREPSTYRGLVWLLTALGITIEPELWEKITAVGMAVAGLLGVILQEGGRVDSVDSVAGADSN